MELFDVPPQPLAAGETCLCSGTARFGHPAGDVPSDILADFWTHHAVRLDGGQG